MIEEINVLKGPRVVIFDLDGTLVEFHRDYLFAETMKILDRLNHPPVEIELLQSSFAAFDYFRFVIDPDPDEFITRFWSHFDWDNFPSARPIEQARDVLSRLREAGIETAVATARLGTAEKVRGDLLASGLLDYISIIVSREDEAIHWTDKRLHIERICSFFGVGPEDTAMVGDIPADITSARAAGVGIVVAVESGGIDPEVLAAHRPDFLLPDISTLLAVLYPGQD